MFVIFLLPISLSCSHLYLNIVCPCGILKCPLKIIMVNTALYLLSSYARHMKKILMLWIPFAKWIDQTLISYIIVFNIIKLQMWSKLLLTFKVLHTVWYMHSKRSLTFQTTKTNFNYSVFNFVCLPPLRYVYCGFLFIQSLTRT